MASSIQTDHPKCKRRRTPSRRCTGSPIGVQWLVLGLLAAGSASADTTFQSGPYFRWGQASTVTGTTLLVHGGMVDVSNTYSYTSAPTTNDLYSLDLSQPFNVSAPNWVYESGSQLPSTSQGPSIAFHSFTVFSNKRALAFGGDGGPNLPISTNSDSAWELDLTTKHWLSWTDEPSGWAQEPMRRMSHSAAVSGKNVWITGGEKADGSGLAFAETWIFDPSGSDGTFSQFSATAGSLPTDLVGHGSVVLSSGMLVLIGGYSPSQNILMPMSTIWMLDTTSSSARWSSVTISGQAPTPRRNFALTLLDNNRLLIHGGGDGSLQNLYADGAILDMGTSSFTWTTAPGLEQLGARSDHMAIGVGSNVLFGFGRGANGPASSGLSFYDSTAGTFGTNFTPASGQTVIVPTTSPGQVTTVTVGSITTVISKPTTMTGPVPSETSTASPSSSSTSSTTGVSDGDNIGTHHSKAAVIALSTLFGIAALVLALLLMLWLWYRRSRRRGRPIWFPGAHHHTILPSGDTEDPILPGAQEREKIPVVGQRLSDPPRTRGLLGFLPTPFSRSESQANLVSQRVDMLRDEDARSFGHLAGGTSAGTTMSAPIRPAFKRFGSSTRQLFSGMINASTTSFKTAFGMGGPETPGAAPDSPDWWDKEVKDPLSGDATEIANLPSLTAVGMAAAARQRGGAPSHSQFPSASTGSGMTSYYRDPFSDSLGHSRTSTVASRGDLLRQDSYHPFMLPLDDGPPMSEFAALGRSPPQSPPPIETAVLRRGPIPQLGIITPGTLASSETSLNASSYPLTPTSETVHSMGDRPRSPNSALNSLLGGAPATPMKRSDSWWTRFGKSSLTGLTRSASGAASLNPIRVLSMRNRSPTDYANLDFHDPNPAPRLPGIEETGKSNDPSPASAKAKKASGGSEASTGKPRGFHSKSMTSMKTADSDALERMGRKMDVVQRNRTTSSEVSLLPTDDEMDFGMVPGPRLVAHHAGTGSTSSFYERPTPPQHSSSGATSGTASQPRRTPSVIVESPAQLTPQSGTQETYQTAFTNLSRPPPRTQQSSPPDSFKTAPSTQASHGRSPPPPPQRKRRLSQGIATRVATYEQMSEPPTPTSPPPLPPPPAGEHRRRTSVGVGVRYGLTERPSLFVANPDRRSATGSTADSVSPPA